MMNAGQRDMIDRAVQRLSPAPHEPRAAAAIDWRFAGALAALIALAPLATIVGAEVLKRGVDAQTAGMQAEAEPRLAAEAQDRAARAMLRDLAAGPTVAGWLERVASVLPADARIARMARPAGGGIEIDVLTPDPDLLRGAIRRDPSLAGLREAGQRRSGAMVLVTLRGRS